MKPSDNDPWNVTNIQVRKCKSRGGVIKATMIWLPQNAVFPGLERTGGILWLRLDLLCFPKGLESPKGLGKQNRGIPERVTGKGFVASAASALPTVPAPLAFALRGHWEPKDSSLQRRHKKSQQEAAGCTYALQAGAWHQVHHLLSSQSLSASLSRGGWDILLFSSCLSRPFQSLLSPPS